MAKKIIREFLIWNQLINFQEFHHFDEMRRCYKNDLRHYMQAMERMKMDDLLERQAATTPPLTLSPPSYVRWL